MTAPLDHMIAPLSLTKHHGLGNDFLIALDPERDLGAADAIAWCDRHTGIGADGLIRAVADGDRRWIWTLWNADGSIPEVSGNGLRCLGQAIAMARGDDTATYEIVTPGGTRTLEVSQGGTWVTVDMGPTSDGPGPSDRLARAGVDVHRQASVAIGNPHLVLEVEDPWTVDLATAGPAIEAGYPDGCNIHFVRVTDETSIDLAVWERGAGITEACGSGACAAAAAAHAWGATRARVDVTMPGGAATVEIGETVLLTGPATHVAWLEVA